MDICSACGCSFEYPTVAEEFALRHVGIAYQRVPACESCATLAQDATFRMIFGFPVGTDLKENGPTFVDRVTT